MDWLLLALLGTVMFTVINYIDKFILERQIRDYRGVPIYTAIVSFGFSMLLWLIDGTPTLPLRDSVVLMVIGALSLIASILYFKGMQVEQASNVIVLLQMQPVLVLVMSFILLGERISALQLVGFVLILSAAVGLSLRRVDNMRLGFSAALLPIIGLNLILALNAVLFKAVVDEHAFIPVAVTEIWGVVLGGVILFVFVPSVRRAFVLTLKTLKRQALATVIFNEVLVIVARTVQNLAISLGAVSLVRVVSSTQIFMAVLIGWLVGIWFPDVYHEDTSRRSLLRKSGYAALMFAGVVLVSQATG